MQVPARITSRKSGQVLEGEKEGNLPPAPVIPFPGANLPMKDRYSKVTQPTSTISKRLADAVAPVPSVTVHLIRNSPLCGGSSGGAGGRGTENDVENIASL